VNNILTKKDAHSNGTPKTYIVQLYIDRPMLYNRRKFDIRHYMMISNMYGIMRGYWYSEGYIRTAGYEFDIYNFEREIHLTNDAVQKYC
jgi:tubulin--tyrosine ligase